MAYIYDLTDTWSAGGTVFNAIKMNVTDSASAVASKLVSLQTNGTEHFSVTKAGAGYFSGNVGIGVAPLANTRIYVRTATVTDTAYYADNGANSGFKVKFASSLTSILNDFGADLVLGTNDTERMRITSSGNVGVGTNSPAGKLHVSGTEVRLQGSASFYSFYDTAGTTRSGYIQNNAGSIALVGELAQPMTFWTSNAERMRITSAGDVGIGTSSPGTKLDIVGAGNPTLTLRGSDAAYSSILNLQAAGGGTSLINATGGSNVLGLYTNTVERMRIDSSGNVGIGVVPSAWAGSKAMQLPFGALSSGYNYSIELASNAYRDNATWRYSIPAATQAATLYEGISGQHVWYNAPSGTAGNAISFTQAMTLDASGNLGVGTTNTAPANGTGLVVAAASTITRIDMRNSTTGTASGDGTSLYLSGNDFTIENRENGYIAFATNLTERARIDSSGNVGIGTADPTGKLHVSGTGYIFSNANTGGVTIPNVAGTFFTYNRSNGLVDSEIIYGNTANSFFRFTQQSSAGVLTERMRIDASGNVGIGTASPGAKLEVDAPLGGVGNALILKNSLATVAGRGASVNFRTSNTNIASIDALTEATVTSGTLRFLTASSGTQSERMRIDSSGNLLVGATAVASYFDGKLNVAGYSCFKVTGSAVTPTQLLWNDATAGNNEFIGFLTEATPTVRGGINYNRAGGLIAYNTTSDYRAKDIIGPVTDAGATIDALKVYNGKMKGATIERPMLIAHEAQEVVPYAVTGGKDAVNEDGTDKYQQMDHQILIPLLIAEIQSLRARVAQLEGN